MFVDVVYLDHGVHDEMESYNTGLLFSNSP